MLPTSLPAGSFRTHLMSSWPLLSSIGVRLHRAGHGEDVVARPRRPRRSCSSPARGACRRRAGGCRPTARPRPAPPVTLTCRCLGCAAAVVVAAAGVGVLGTLDDESCGVLALRLGRRPTPAAIWPGDRAWKVGGLPIKVAMRGAACWAMRDTSRSLASAKSCGLRHVRLIDRFLRLGRRRAIRSRSRCPARRRACSWRR